MSAIAVNRVVDPSPVERIEDALDAPAESIPVDSRMCRTVIEERPIVAAARGSEPAEAIASLASRL